MVHKLWRCIVRLTRGLAAAQGAGAGAGQGQGQQGQGAGAGQGAQAAVGRFLVGANDIWDLNMRNWNAAQNSTLTEKLAFILVVIRQVGEREHQRALYPVLLIVLAYATKGQLSERRLSRIITELRPHLGPLTEMLRMEDILMTWQNFGQYINDATAEAVIRRWAEFLPAGAVRLRVALDQARGSGLTGLDVVARAIHEHPHFPWHLIMRMYPAEWAAVRTAIVAVGDNRYFGFRQNLTVVRSSLFKYVSWVSGLLLIAAGDKTLDSYKGFVKNVAHESVVQNLIQSYLEATAGAIDLDVARTDDELDDIVEMAEIAAAYPVNAAP